MNNLSHREEEERLNLFAEAKPVGGQQFISAGIFTNRVDDYLNNFAKIVHRIINRKTERLFEVFENFLKFKNYVVEGQAKYSREAVTKWRKAYRIYKNDVKVGSFYRLNSNQKLNVYGLTLGTPSDVESKRGLVILRVEGYEDVEIDRKVEWELRELVLEEWLKLGSKREVKDYLGNVKEVFEDIKNAIGGKYYEYPFYRLAFYLLPLHFDRFFNGIIISRASLFYRREETKQNLWKEIENALKDRKRYNDLQYYYSDKGNDKGIDHIKNLLDYALQEENLKLMREDWKEFVKKICQGKSQRIKGVFLEKEKVERNAWLSYGEYLIPNKDIRVYIYHEPGTEGLLKDLREALKKLPYMPNLKVEFEESYRPIYQLFGGKEFFDALKGVNRESSELKNEEAKKILYALLNFAGWITNIQASAVRYAKAGKFAGNFLLLDTDLLEQGRYEFWEYVRFIYDYFGLPVQTITRRTLEILKRSKKVDAIKKNLMISFYKDAKVLRFEFDGFELQKDRFFIYVFLERPSPKFFYRKGDIRADGLRHYLYEVYKIEVENNKAQLEIEEKFFVMAGGFEGDMDAMRKFIDNKLKEKQAKFCFITAVKDSFLNMLYEEYANYPEFKERALSVRYMEIKTGYMSSKVEEQDCFVIYSDDFSRILSKLGIKIDEDKAIIAIKPPPPSSIDRFGDLYHPALQVFFTEKIGWLRDEIYSRRKNLFFFTMIALSMFESEAAMTAFSKLNVWSTRRGEDIVLTREELNYRFGLWSSLFELLEFIRHVPGSDSRGRSKM